MKITRVVAVRLASVFFLTGLSTGATEGHFEFETITLDPQNDPHVPIRGGMAFSLTPSGGRRTRNLANRAAPPEIGTLFMHWNCLDAKKVCFQALFFPGYSHIPETSTIKISVGNNVVVNENLTGLSGCYESEHFTKVIVTIQVVINFCSPTGCGNASASVSLTSPLGCQASGDPHFITWDGTRYSYHGGCDMVFAQSPSFANGIGLFVYIRTAIRSSYSFISNAAIKIGDDVLEIEVDGSHYFNGLEGLASTVPAVIGRFPIRATCTCRKLDPTTLSGCAAKKNQCQYTIKLDADDVITISTFNGFLGIDVRAPLVDFSGLMGTHGKTGMIDRNGNPLTDPIAMGTEWQVRDTEPMIFHTIEGPQFPQPCNLPKSNAQMSLAHTQRFSEMNMAVEGRRRRALRGLTSGGVPNHEAFHDEAIAACEGAANFEACWMDIMVTGDLDMALLYVDVDL